MHLKSRAILGVVTVGAAIGAALVPATSAFAAPGLQITSPEPTGLGLQNGDVVAVSGTGFPASQSVIVIECSAPADASTCDPSTIPSTPVMTDATGAFTANVTVKTGVNGDSTKCGAASTCFVNATTNATAPDPNTNAAGGQIAFDRLQISPRTNLKNGQTINVVGGGFNPSANAYVSECTSADPTQAAQKCDLTNFATFPTDANGGFSRTYVVHTGQIGSDGSTCDPGKSCIVAASDNVANPTAGHIGGGVVSFAQLKALAVSAKASKGHVAKGKSFKMSGKAKSAGAGVSGLKVVLDKIKGGTPSKVAGGKTGSGGAYSFKLSQKKTTKYVVVIASQKGYKAAVSKTVKVSTP